MRKSSNSRNICVPNITFLPNLTHGYKNLFQIYSCSNTPKQCMKSEPTIELRCSFLHIFNFHMHPSLAHSLPPPINLTTNDISHLPVIDFLASHYTILESFAGYRVYSSHSAVAVDVLIPSAGTSRLCWATANSALDTIAKSP